MEQVKNERIKKAEVKRRVTGLKQQRCSYKRKKRWTHIDMR